MFIMRNINPNGRTSRTKRGTITYMTEVWTFSYADREPAIEALRWAALETPLDTLTGLTLWVNNNFYSLEFYVAATIDINSRSAHDVGEELRRKFGEAQGRKLPEGTINTLNKALTSGKKYFNCASLTNDANQFDEAIEVCFIHPSRRELEARGFGSAPIVASQRVFLSYQSDRKPQIRTLSSLLAGRDISCWFDEDSIRLGEVLFREIDAGISDSSAVVFWISRGFLESSWCKYEMEGFISKVASKGNVKIFSIIDWNVDIDSLPDRIQYTTWMRADSDTTEVDVFNRIAPEIERYFLENRK